MLAVYVIIGVVVALLGYAVILYNSLVGLRQRTNEAWSDIDVQLKRRYDLIPNLVETVKGYASHEKEVFERVTQARTAAMQATGIEDKGKAENILEGTLKSLFAVSEAYPDLKANQNFLELQRELSDTENKIQASRRFYNSNVMNLNTQIEMFPANLFAASLGFSKREYFEAEEGEKANVKVSFNDTPNDTK
jgi:LemA protein